jgi:hypothetical protein
MLGTHLSPLWGWDPGLLFTPGLRPGLHSYAAPRLKPQRAHFIRTFYERRYSNTSVPELWSSVEKCIKIAHNFTTL